MELLLALGALGLVAGLVGSGSDDEDTETLNATSDNITGTPDDDTIYTEGGDDFVLGLAGNDTIGLGQGNDTANGGEGEDTIYGGQGNDDVVGGPDDDRIFLGDGSDDHVGDDMETDHAGDDLIRGGDGADFIFDVVGANTVYGELGADFIVTLDEPGTADAPDSAFGGFGSDIMLGDDGDTLEGGDGVDSFGVFSDETGDAVTVITDFAADEGLILQFDRSEFDEYDDTDVTTQVSGDDLRILVDGRDVALLRDVASINVATQVTVQMLDPAPFFV